MFQLFHPKKAFRIQSTKKMVDEYLTHFVNLDEEDDLEVTLDDEELEDDDKEDKEDKDGDLLDPDPIEEDT